MNIKDTVKTLINLPVHISVMLKGSHGIGKSQIVKQVADHLGIPCIDFRLSQNDVGDIKGIPFQRNGRTVFAPPEFMPITKEDAQDLKNLLGLTEDVSVGRFGDSGILFLDEINRASREVQQAAFELVLDRRLNMRSLPEGWRVVTAINDNDSLYSVGTLDPAFISRFMIIDFAPTFEEWIEWAKKNEIHNSVISFLENYPELLDPSAEIIEESSCEGVNKIFDRRSWHRFSDTLKSFEENGYSLFKEAEINMDYLYQLADGFVGNIAALKFNNFLVDQYNKLSAIDLLVEWDTAVHDKLVPLVQRGCIPELVYYNEQIVKYIKESRKYGCPPF